MRKVATFQFVDVKRVDTEEDGLVKLASTAKISGDEAKKTIEAEVKKHPGALFFRAKAIEADVPNNNGDSFSSEELKKSCGSFVGVPFFTNHNNQNVEDAKGKVVWSEWDNDEKSIFIVAFVDRDAYPNLCRGIEQEYMTGVSMGCSVEYSECSICRNRAATMDDYCVHIRNLKGRNYTGTVKDAISGETKTVKDRPVYENNFGIRFIELSGVADPACTSCRIDAIYDNGELCSDKAASTNPEPLTVGFQEEFLKAAASCYNDCAILKTAALQKEASEQDVQALNGCLEALEGVSVKLIQNRANVEMEFASDLVQILANLQDFVDQLVQAGYGQLPEAAGEAIPGSLPEEGAAAAPGLGTAAPQQISAEGDLELGATNVEEPLVEPPQAPGLGDFNQTTRPAPSRQTSKVTRPTRPKRKSESEEHGMKRRLPSKTAKDRDEAVSRLSGAWKEKVNFYSSKLRETLKQDPAISSGGHKMADNKNVVEAKSQQADLHEITEKQLDKGNTGANKREDDEREVVTEKQLDSLREGERDVVTEKQLDGSDNLVPREDDGRESITEKQLGGTDPNARTDKERVTITQDQLEPERVGNPDVITEKQLSNPPVDTPWARSASSISKHVEAAIDIVAKATIATSSTPDQVLKTACSISGSVASERLAFASEIWNTESDATEIADVVSTNNFWAAKNTKLAGGTIREALLTYASDAVKKDNLNPELVVESIHGIRENDASYSVEERVDELIATASEDAEEEVNVKSQVASYFQTKKAENDASDDSSDRFPSDDNGKEKGRKCHICGKDSECYAEDDEGDVCKTCTEASTEAEELVEALSKDETKVADHIIQTNLAEIGFDGDVNTEAFKERVASFARGACASSSIKLAAVVNVTIDDDVVTIAVETDNESVEIPIGDEKEELDVMDELPDMPEMPAEEPAAEPVLDEMAPMPEAPAPSAGEDLLGLASSKKTVKKAQFGGGDPGVPNAGGGAAPPEDLANTPDVMPEEGGIQTFTEEDTEEELPGEEDQKMAGSICALCGSDDTETGRKDQMPGQFDCNECGAKYTVHVNIDLLNPEDVLMNATEEDGLEEPDLPEMPVAACVDLSKGVLTKLADSFNSGEASCPACGKTAKVEGCPSSHKVACDNCGTESKRDIIMNVDEPSEAKVKIEWNLKPIKSACKGCEGARKAFAGDLAFRKMIVAASKSEFPEAQASAWVTREYGDDAVVSYGPHKGTKLAETVIDQLKTFGLEKVKYMRRLCEVQVKDDPMEVCVQHQRKTAGYSKEEATRVCDCLKKKYATEEDDNIFMEAFANMIDTTILRKMAEHVVAEEEGEVPEEDDAEMLISDIAVEEKAQVSFDGQDDIGTTATTEDQVMEKAAAEKKQKITDLEGEDDVPKGDGHMGGEKEAIPEAKAPVVPRAPGGGHLGNEKDTDPGDQEVSIPVDLQYLGEEEPIGDKEIETDTLGLVIASEDVKGKPHMSDDKGGAEGKNIGEVDGIESSDNVPRGDAKMGNEEPCDCKGPEVPRSDAKMGGESETVPNAEKPTVPYEEAEKVEMIGQVAAKREEQVDRISQARRDKAVKLAASMVAHNQIVESEFEGMVSDLVKLPIDRMEFYASKVGAQAAPSVKTASTLTTAIVQEDRGIVEAEEPKSLADRLSDAFTIGSKQSDKYYKRGDVDDQ